MRFLYSQDLSNRKTNNEQLEQRERFLYSQDLSNRKTFKPIVCLSRRFLYSQDLSNRKTGYDVEWQVLNSFCTLRI